MRRRGYQRMEFKAPRHPSGLPITTRHYRELGFPRPVNDEPLTPGLRPGRGYTEAIGFGIHHVDEDDEE